MPPPTRIAPPRQGGQRARLLRAAFAAADGHLVGDGGPPLAVPVLLAGRADVGTFVVGIALVPDRAGVDVLCPGRPGARQDEEDARELQPSCSFHVRSTSEC